MRTSGSQRVPFTALPLIKDEPLPPRRVKHRERWLLLSGFSDEVLIGSMVEEATFPFPLECEEHGAELQQYRSKIESKTLLTVNFLFYCFSILFQSMS